jgi:hypothetical protein
MALVDVFINWARNLRRNGRILHLILNDGCGAGGGAVVF